MLRFVPHPHMHPPLTPLPILYTSVVGPIVPTYSHHIMLVFSLSLHDDAKRGKFPFFIKLSVWLHLERHTALLGLSHTRATRDRPRRWNSGCSEVV